MEPPPAFGVPVISPPVKCKYRNVNVPPSILKWRLSFAAVIVTKLFISIFVPIISRVAVTITKLLLLIAQLELSV